MENDCQRDAAHSTHDVRFNVSNEITVVFHNILAFCYKRIRKKVSGKT